MSPFHSFVLAHDIRFITLTPAHVLITRNLCVIISGDLYETECDVENRKKNRRRSGIMIGLTQFVSISVERHYPPYRYFRGAEIELNSNTSEIQISSIKIQKAKKLTWLKSICLLPRSWKYSWLYLEICALIVKLIY